MGAGKSTVGKKLSKLLRFEFLDSDVLIAREQGCSISDIFKTFGEAYFRELESTLLNKISGLDHIVVATGGGAILNHVTRNILVQSGCICYLKVDIQQQLLRLSADSHGNHHRALLPVQDVLRLNFLQQNFLKREPLYNSIANISIDTSHLNIDTAAQQILHLCT